MPETIQVVRIEDVQRLFPVTTEIENGQLWAVLGDLANEYRVGDVIELTEKRAMIGWEHRRWVSGWKTANE